jgi:cell division protein FtsX
MFLLAILYAFRAELHRAEPDLNVGVLLGASSSFVAMPHVLVSTIAGALGLGIAAGILALAWPQMTAHASWLATVQPHEVVVMGSVLAVAGLLVCWWQSVSTVSRRTRAKRG